MAEARILVTGASGFVGRHLVPALLAAGYGVRVALRRPKLAPAGTEAIAIGDLAGPVDWRPALAGIDHVVHLAGLAHAGPGLPEALYERVNTDATLALAQAARQEGIGRLVFLSSIKALTGAAHGRVGEDDTPAPADAYGRSKLAAERGLAAADLDWVALRPVLVYGAGVKANMAALIALARLPLPLPLGGLTAPRSLLAVENLVDAILFALTPACPARRAYLVADPEPVSVAQVLALLRQGLGRRPGLLKLPVAPLRAAARLAGRGESFDKLAGGLVALPEGLIRAGWRAPLPGREALARLAQPTRPGAGDAG